tara:strand:+ start:816 stop:986 length:171 start_codon:yes stop_codon:yes gene_type:complete
MFGFIKKIRMGLAHASYHRNLRKANAARENQDILKFKKYIYKSEDSYKRLIKLINK